MRGAQADLSGERPAKGAGQGRRPLFCAEPSQNGGSSKPPPSGAPLAITCGDPAGVGPELIERILGAREAQPLSFSGPLAVIGPSAWLSGLPDCCEKIAVGDSAFRARAGVPSEAGARVALEAMECAAAGCVSGRFSGVVTGPVSKAELAKVGYPFPGQTEFFAARWGEEPVMGFVGERLRVVLATWHVPLAEVRQTLTEARLTRAVAAAADLGSKTLLSCEPPAEARRTASAAEPSASVGGSAPETVSSRGVRERARIAVCGLNPHAGEGGLLGAEECDFLNPILEKLSARYSGLVPQCLPGDTVFARALRGEFDVVVALYHDQGLAPLKAVDFDTAVNVTLGLPFVRTSPDHGTAFGLAGKGTASAQSFANAIRLAQRLLRERSRA